MIDSPTTTPETAIDRYARTRDPDAFAALVRQYQRLVYAAASRRLARREDVEDATQQAFVNLARAAGGVRRDVGGWLYRAAQHAAIDLIRRDSTRRRHEATLAAPTDSTTDGSAEWRELSAAIDDAIAALPDEERSLVVEHFLAGRAQRDLAAATGMSQSTIQRRLESAVARLREHLTQAGHGGAAAVVATHLPTFGAADVPASLSAELAKVGLAAPLAKTTGVAIGAKVAAGVAIVAVAGAGAAVARQMFSLAAPAPIVAPASPAAAPTPTEPPLEAIARVYRLADDEDIAFFPPPFPPERAAFVAERNFGPADPSSVGFATNGARLTWRAATYATNDDVPLHYVAESLLRFEWYQYDETALKPLVASLGRGDWVVRDELPIDRRAKALAKAASDATGWPVTLEPVTELRPCIVRRGPLPDAIRLGSRERRRVVLSLDAAADAVPKGAPAPINWGRLRDASRDLDAPFFEANAPDFERIDGVPIDYIVMPSARLSRRDPGYREKLRRVLDSLTGQLGGDWSIEDREIETWVATLPK